MSDFSNQTSVRPIYVGRQYKLKNHRSHIDGRKALIVTVTAIINNVRTESHHRHDRFIATDGRVEYYSLSRSELREISQLDKINPVC